MTKGTSFDLAPTDFGLVGAPASINTLEDWRTFEKAMQSSYETNHANLTGMSALRVESLEPSLRAVIAKAKNFTFLNCLKRTPTTSALQEWNVQTSIGGQYDGMSFGEMGEIAFDQGEYERKVERVKLFATGNEITVFADAQTLIRGADNLRAQANKTGLTRLSAGFERSLIHANERNSPDRINGLVTQISNFNEGQNVIDIAGRTDVNELPSIIYDAKANVRQADVWGDITHCFTDAVTQKDLDMDLFPDYRVHLDESNGKGVTFGAPVRKIATSNGDVEMREMFLSRNANNSMPYIVLNKGRLPDKYPGQPTVTATSVPVAAKGKARGWDAQNAGTVWVVACAVDKVGREGVPSDFVAVTVPEGGAFDLSAEVFASGAVPATCYRYYVSPMNMDRMPTLADMRFLTEQPVNTVYRNVNQEIPGSSHIFLLNLDPDAIDIVQLRPATQFPLAVTNTLTERWASYLFATLRLGIPQHHFYAKNYLPKRAIWKPW